MKNVVDVRQNLAITVQGLMSTGFGTVTAILALAVVYLGAGKLGLSWASIHTSTSAVWPASGIGIAALLLWGYRLWPGIFLGAFLVNVTTSGLDAATLGIASGNTLESLVGAWLINRYADGVRVFERARTILVFILLAAISSTSISASFGAISLTLSGLAPWEQFQSIWLTWWLGDMAGILLITPLVTIWARQPRAELVASRAFEAAALLISLLLLNYAVFFTANPLAAEYTAILPLLWAAFRFGRHGAVTAAFLTSIIALHGPFQGTNLATGQDVNAALLHLQVFMGTLAMTALVLAAVISEARRVEQRLQVQDAISRILVESPDLLTAGPRVLQVLCEIAGWNTGALWKVNRSGAELACVEMWHMPSVEIPRFEAATRERKFTAGVGLTGQVWSSGDAVWISDVTKDSNFPRAAVAAKEGLHAAFGFPLKLGTEVYGVIECFSREVRQPDDHFLQMVRNIGTQLGQFIERKGAEEAQQASEKELSDFFDTAAQGLHWVGRDGTILRVNQAELKMLGYSRQEYLGHNIAEFHVDAETINDIMKHLAGADVLHEYPAKMRCKDGSIREVVIDSSVYWDNGEFVHTRCFTRDVTDLKRAEEARAMLASIVESSDDAIISKNLDGIITSWNAGAQRLFGYRAEEMIRQSILRIIPPELEESETDILARLRRGERIEHYETVRLTRDGRRVDVSLTISPVRDSEGRIIGASKIARDITERKVAEQLLNQAQDALLIANKQLEQRVQERTADLDEANAALLKHLAEQQQLEEQLRQAQKMESIGTLAGGIAHDFNNVLNIIRGYATLVSRRSSGDQHVVESMQIINEEVDRGAAVVRQLLTLARKTETLLTRTDANRVVTTVSALVRQTFPKIIEVRLDLDGALPTVLADPNQLNQALLNICVNARDAMPTGGTLTFTTEVVNGHGVQHNHPDAKPESYVCIAIRDSGTGMEESVRLRIFEPFFTTKQFGEGTGLGLAMVYGLIKNHNGFVDVESEPGTGTTFRLYLPASDASEQTAIEAVQMAETPAQALNGHPGTVLVVEDEAAMVRLLSDWLERAGYQVLVAMEGEEAITLYQRHKDKIGVVLVDLNLPKVNGADVIRELKEQSPDVNIVVASGYLQPEIKLQLSQAGVTDYIHKPYWIDDVLKKIGSLLQSP